MNKISTLWLAFVIFLAPVLTGLSEEPKPALSLVIVYDGSGSMKEKVPAADGKKAPKYVIANRAIDSIADKLQEFCDSRKTNIEAGLVMFTDSRVRAAIPFGTYRASQFKDWARSFKTPNGGTPLGDAIQLANAMLANSHSPRKHILVVTDGESNMGPSPEAVVNQIKSNKEPASVYFVAFDVEARVFEPVKAQGATVVSASDETLLRVQIDTIVGKKILLEAE